MTRPSDGRPCAGCSYDLSGHSSVGRCPECGLDYDPHATVILLKPARYPAKQAIGLAVLVTFMFYPAPAPPDRDAMVRAALFLAVLGLLYLFVCARRLGRNARLVICRHGVRFEGLNVRADWIPWSRISKAKRSAWTGRLRLLDHEDRRILGVPREWIGSVALVQACVRAINTRRERYC